MWKKSEEPAELTKICLCALQDNQIEKKKKKLGKIMPPITINFKNY